MGPTPDDYDDRLDRIREPYADGPGDMPTIEIFLDEDVAVCADDYPEHDTRDTYVGEDGTQWECTRCGAEGWESAE